MNTKNCRLDTVIILDDPQQFYHLITHSIFLLSRKDQLHVYQLHACDDFYVELRLDQYGCGLQDIGLFRSTERLMPYLETIQLEPLFNY